MANIELRANEIGAILLFVIAIAQRHEQSDLTTDAIRSAREALLKIPDSLSDEFLFQAATWTNSVETARALLYVFDSGND